MTFLELMYFDTVANITSVKQHELQLTNASIAKMVSSDNADRAC